MIYLYTTEPDEGCREVKNGIYGRPVHTYEQKALKAKGWKEFIYDLREEEGREEGQEVSRKTVELDMPEDPLERSLRTEYYQKFGKKAHHKVKVETLKKKLGY